MPINEPHEPETLPPPGSISTHASDWLQTFVKHFELDFVDAVAILPSADESDYQRSAIIALMRILQDSGLSLEAIVEALAKITNGQDQEPMEWTPDLNARRFALIDREIQGDLTLTEQFELARLTNIMRRAVETEVYMPMEGARALHRKLIELIGQRKPR